MRREPISGINPKTVLTTKILETSSPVATRTSFNLTLSLQFKAYEEYCSFMWALNNNRYYIDVEPVSIGNHNSEFKRIRFTSDRVVPISVFQTPLWVDPYGNLPSNTRRNTNNVKCVQHYFQGNTLFRYVVNLTIADYSQSESYFYALYQALRGAYISLYEWISFKIQMRLDVKDDISLLQRIEQLYYDSEERYNGLQNQPQVYKKFVGTTIDPSEIDKYRRLWQSASDSGITHAARLDGSTVIIDDATGFIRRIPSNDGAVSNANPHFGVDPTSTDELTQASLDTAIQSSGTYNIANNGYTPITNLPALTLEEFNLIIDDTSIEQNISTSLAQSINAVNTASGISESDVTTETSE